MPLALPLVTPAAAAVADKAGAAAAVVGALAGSEAENGEEGEKGCCACRPVLGSMFSLLWHVLHSAWPPLPLPPSPPLPPPPLPPPLSGRRHKPGAVVAGMCCGRRSPCLLRFFGELRRQGLGATLVGWADAVAPVVRFIVGNTGQMATVVMGAGGNKDRERWWD